MKIELELKLPVIGKLNCDISPSPDETCAGVDLDENGYVFAQNTFKLTAKEGARALAVYSYGEWHIATVEVPAE